MEIRIRVKSSAAYEPDLARKLRGLSMRLDTFRPNLPIDDPDQFVGRESALKSFFEAISQIQAGQPRHLAITGERGVGKSSFLNQILRMAEGDTVLLDRLGLKAVKAFDFRTVPIRVASKYDIPELCNAFESRLRSAASRFFERAKETVKFDLKIITIDFAEFKGKPTGAEDAFVRLIADAHDKLRIGQVAGLILAVDEIDRMDASVGLGTFFKLVTEELSRAGYPKVSFIVCGVTGSVQKLAQEHPSASRTFREIPIDTMSEGEVRSILHGGFERAGCKYDDNIAKTVLFYSRGLGSRVHLIGSHCLQVDTDDCVDENDVVAALDVILSETLKNDFESQFRAAGGGRYREILKIAANESRAIVHVQTIAEKLGLSQNQFSTNMGTLLERGVLNLVESGRYEFVDPLLREYVRRLPANGVNWSNEKDL